MKLQLLSLKFSNRLLNFEIENKDWFESWVPPRPEGYHTLEGFNLALNSLLNEINNGEGLYFILTEGENIVGRFNISEICDGTPEIGYRIHQNFSGKGFAKEGVRLLIEKASEYGLSRLKAEALIENYASTSILISN